MFVTQEKVQLKSNTFTQIEFMQHFLINQQSILGRGFDSNVYQVMKINTQETYALKCSNLQNPSTISTFKVRSEQSIFQLYQQQQNEIHILSNICHRNIIKYYAHSEDNSCVILELCPYGSLSKLIHIGFDAATTRGIFIQILEAVQYLHKQAIVHGDIKPENILVCSDCCLKICDFGFSKVVGSLEGRLIGGSKGFIAPEIYMLPQYDERKCDIFSLGVLLFVVNLGHKPFISSNPQDFDQLWRLISLGDWPTYWKIIEKNIAVEEPFKVLIQGMIEPLPKNRLSLLEVMSSEWMSLKQSSVNEIKQELMTRIKMNN